MSIVRDLRVAYHSLLRTPGLALAVIVTLALGIGANAAIFTLVRGILLKPLVPCAAWQIFSNRVKEDLHLRALVPKQN